MSSISQFQSVFRVSKNGSKGVASKRNRQPISCSPCRARKLKCDRSKPCASCLKRDDAPSCTYNSGTNGNERHRSKQNSEAQLRLQQLESMVTNLMQAKQNGSSKGSETPQEDTSIDQRLGSLSFQGSERSSESPSSGHLDADSKFYGATHWVAILDNIREIQGVLEDEDTAAAVDQSTFDTMLDTSEPLSTEAVLDFLPRRGDCDKLLSNAFTAKHIQIPFIHHGKFLREYELFWLNPSSASYLWISILFSMLHIGAKIDQLVNQQLTQNGKILQSMAFLLKAGQALATGHYRRAKPYSVEALLIYTICKHMTKEDPEIEIWTMVGVAARIAMRRGYHRDPSKLPCLTPFEGEMRRRAFITIENFDLLLSFQAGLPPILHEDECDTNIPRNLFDSDFDEDSPLPRSRPDTDSTPILYYSTKNLFCKVFRKVFRLALSPTMPPYEETIKVSDRLLEGYKNIPVGLRHKPISSSFTDQAYIILHRFNLELLYNKSICVLHRRFLTYDRQNPKYEYSRKASVDAALRILDLQLELKVACSPGGQFYTNKWMLGSITLHDFLLAAMVACLALYESHKTGITMNEEVQTLQRMYDALQLSYDIWTSRMSFSIDAKRASKVLAIMLMKIPRPGGEMLAGDQSSLGLSEGPSVQSMESGVDSLEFGTDHEHELVQDTIPCLDPNDPLNEIFNAPEDLDWGLLDQGLIDATMNEGFASNWHLHINEEEQVSGS